MRRTVAVAFAVPHGKRILSHEPRYAGGSAMHMNFLRQAGSTTFFEYMKDQRGRSRRQRVQLSETARNTRQTCGCPVIRGQHLHPPTLPQMDGCRLRFSPHQDHPRFPAKGGGASFLTRTPVAAPPPPPRCYNYPVLPSHMSDGFSSAQANGLSGSIMTSLAARISG